MEYITPQETVDYDDETLVRACCERNQSCSFISQSLYGPSWWRPLQGGASRMPRSLARRQVGSLCVPDGRHHCTKLTWALYVEQELLCKCPVYQPYLLPRKLFERQIASPERALICMAAGSQFIHSAILLTLSLQSSISICSLHLSTS